VSNFSTRPNLDNRDFTQTTGSTLTLYGQLNIDGSFFSKGVNINFSTGSSVMGYVLTHTVNGIELKAPSSGFTGSSGGGVGDITGATNIGGGVGIFAQKSNKDFDFKSLIPLSAITISGSSNIVYIGVNVDETRTQNRNTVPNSKLLDDEIILNRSYQLPVNTITGITGTYILDLSQGELQTLLLAGNTTLNYTGETVGKTYTIVIIKETTNKTLTLASGRYSVSFGEPIDTTDPTTNSSSPARSVDIITLMCIQSGRLVPVVTPDIQDN
jgi:hypothetical protein